MYRYIPMLIVQYRKHSLSGVNSILRLNESNNYKCIPPHKNSQYNRKKEFLESCNSSEYLNIPGNISTVTEVINSILESGTKTQIHNTVTFIANDIIPKLKSFNPFINGLNKTLLTEEYEQYINDIIKVYNECDRILSNDDKLSKRFNFNKYISEQYNKKAPRDLVFSLCEMIDTYNIPLKAKYNIALENVQYSIHNSPINGDNVVKDVTDYFLLRETVIPDSVYNGYTDVLQNNPFIDPEELSKLRFTKINSRIKYIDKIEYIRNHDIDDEKTGRIMDDLKNITTEDHASHYIKTVYNAIITDSSMTDNDKEILKKSIYMIPLISSIDKPFIDYECNKLDGSLLSTRDLLETVNFISKTINESTIDNMCCSNIHDTIESFKLSQDKSPNKFIQLMNSINPNSNAMVDIIIKELPELLCIMRYTYVLYSNTSNSSVIEELYSLVYRICSANPEINSYINLVKILNDEKIKCNSAFISTSNDGGDKIKEYLYTLDKCIKLVNNTMYSIDDIPFNESCIDEFNIDDISFEEYVSLIETLSMGIDNINKLNKEQLLSSIADNIRLFTTDTDNLRNLSNVIIISKSIDKSAYEDVLIKVKDNTDDNAEKLIIANEISYINTFKLNTDVITESLLAIEANNILSDLFSEVLTEASKPIKKDSKKKGINFNDIQLAMKGFTNKIKNLDYKVQAMWKNIDMYGNNIIKSIQKSLTSDRREDIIKGNILPSMSKCIKYIIAIAGTSAVGSFFGAPYIGILTLIGIFATSKYLNDKERMQIYDEIDTELKVVEKEIEMALNDGDTKKYRFLLTYQKKLNREKMRIKYGSMPKAKKIPV